LESVLTPFLSSLLALVPTSPLARVLGSQLQISASGACINAHTGRVTHQQSPRVPIHEFVENVKGIIAGHTN